MDDICRNNHGGNPESEAANARVNKAVGLTRVMAMITAAGWQGHTCDELETLTGMSHQTCSARCSDLLKFGHAIRKPENSEIGYERRRTRAGTPAGVLIDVKLLKAEQFKLF